MANLGQDVRRGEAQCFMALNPLSCWLQEVPKMGWRVKW
jgi:hypothetical protein